MKIKRIGLFMAGLLGLSTVMLWADAGDTIAHPVKAFHEHEVKEDEAKTGEISDARKMKKAEMDQAKDEYEANLKQYGATNDLTKKAKERYESARKEYRKLVKKGKENAQELNKDLGKVQQDKQ